MSEICALVAEGIIAIDTEFVRRRMDASHLIVDDGHAAFLSARLATRDFMGDAAEQPAVLDGDIALNAAGLALWLARRSA